jgi:Nuclease-related domain
MMKSLPVEIPFWVWPAAAGVVVLAALAWGYWLLRAYRTRRAIDAAIANVSYEMLKNVLIPNGMGGQIHVHYLLLTQRGLLVADLLDRPGAIFGGDQMIEWTAIGKKRRYTFANPQHALYDRMAAVKLLTGEVPVEGRLVFTLRSEFPKGKPRNVLRIDDLAEDFPPVDKARGAITAAFGDVWANVKKNAEPNPFAA